ncbi:MAG: S-layer homology domain-containing protein [Oscillospiraceae bacterium]|nr:S-layer homology domain-containing protein [Oscillospiraceae bacterium]
MRKKFGILLLLLAFLAVMLFLRREEKPEVADVEKPLPQEQMNPAQGALSVHVARALGEVNENPDGEGIVISLTKEDGTAETLLFEDVTMDAWYLEAVDYVASVGLMRNVATSSGRSLFYPDHGVTRAQFATILYRFCGGSEVEPVREYEDVPDFEWYYDMIHWVDRQRLLDRMDDTVFGVAEHLSCEEALTALHRVAGEPESMASLEDYPYALKVSPSGMSAVRWAWGVGLIAEDECIWYPTQAIARAQLALLLMRYDELSTAAEK